ncbi:DegT/DnrJ/EryC1/StrS family aminotransferase [Leptospira vanthielii]|uniref:DegT/DnrJ/EryC1/StrS aminotransferase family protein n=2 Tax=Leptospira vanthielii TaxID=293085 RepID=A0ABY2NNR9_9LEPT|nr:DegT/DnrJ/EryC1/StrS aminotransferase family protein [Leptospira vanthielii]EMY70326.1 putative spore coat polysaccharide biosynthesis protein SpsC [Leptospira vanthielii serovar Holland str. Waz Holland = ATCC 700522]TGM52693.1 DegT/DnrJ/EryC1/StrS aminotransferase family protein [Leptospira vanthielii]
MLTSRKTFLPFALPSISEDAIEEVAQVLRSGWVTSGPKVKQFEMEFSDFVGSKETIAVNSATAGLHLALEAIGLTSEDAAITSAVTFTATTEVICYFGAEPILTDVDPIHNLMTPTTLRETIESKCKWNGKELKSKKSGKQIKAILPVHLAGYTCDMEGLLAIAKEYNLYVIEDAAHAFPAVHKDKMIGTWGDFTVFSFYATKGITTGEGGMVTTSHKEAAERIRKMRLHGINRDAFNRPGWYYEVVDAGFKYNMTDIAAALGVVQLKESHRFWERRTEIAKHYNQEFSSLKGIKLPKEDSNGLHSWHLYRIELDPKIAKVGRDSFVEELKEKNIGTSLHFIPIFEHPYYKKTFQYNRKEYPNACQMYDRSISLPLFAGMSESDEKDVIDAVKGILG